MAREFTINTVLNSVTVYAVLYQYKTGLYLTDARSDAFAATLSSGNIPAAVLAAYPDTNVSYAQYIDLPAGLPAGYYRILGQTCGSPAAFDLTAPMTVIVDFETAQLDEVEVIAASNAVRLQTLLNTLYPNNAAPGAIEITEDAAEAIEGATVLNEGTLTTNLVPSGVNASASITVSSGSLIATGGQTIIIDNQEAQTLSYNSGTGLLIVGPNQFGTAVTGNAGDTFVVPVAATKSAVNESLNITVNQTIVEG